MVTRASRGPRCGVPAIGTRRRGSARTHRSWGEVLARTPASRFLGGVDPTRRRVNELRRRPRSDELLRGVELSLDDQAKIFERMSPRSSAPLMKKVGVPRISERAHELRSARSFSLTAGSAAAFRTRADPARTFARDLQARLVTNRVLALGTPLSGIRKARIAGLEPDPLRHAREALGVFVEGKVLDHEAQLPARRSVLAPRASARRARSKDI